MIQIKRTLLFIVLSIILTSCSIVLPTVKEDAFVDIEGLYGEERQFTLAGLPSYVDEKEV